MMILLITILLSVICGTAAAQQPLNFDDALALAMEHNKMLRSKRSDVTTAYYELQATRGLYYPKVQLNGAYMLTQRDIAVDISGAKGVIESGANNLINQGVAAGVFTPAVGDMLRAMLSPLQNIALRYTIQKRSFGVVAAKLSMPIYVGGRIRAANRAAKIRLDMEEYELDAAQNHLYTTLVEQYYGVVVLQYAVDVRRAVVNAVTQHLDDARAMEEEGVIAHSMVLGVEYRLAEVMRELAHEEHRLLMAKRALCSTIGVGEDIVTTDNLFVYNDIQNADYYIDNAANFNSMLRGAELNIDLAREGVVAAQAELLPSVAVVGAGSIYDYRLSGMLPRWVVGVEAGIVLFDGLAKERRLKAAKSRMEGAVNEVENGRDNVRLLAENEYYNMQNALVDIETSYSSIAAADSYYLSALEGFRAGVVSATELLDAEVARAASKLALFDAAYNYCVSLARLLEASGLSHTFTEYRQKGLCLYVESDLINNM